MPSDSPSDRRLFVRVAVDMPSNPKIAALDDPVAAWAHVTAICYCGEHLTDGVFPLMAVLRQAGAPKTKGDKLARAQLWHKPGHDCTECVQPPSGHAVVHDYLKHQYPAAHIRTVSSARSVAGRKGAAARWETPGPGPPDGKPHGKPHGKPLANGVATTRQTAWQTHGKPMADLDLEPGVRFGGEVPVSNVHAKERPSSKPDLNSENRPPSRCPEHVDLDGDPGPCRDCGDWRRTGQEWDRRHAEQSYSSMRSCTWCDADGWRVDPRHKHRGPLGPPGVRCDHTPLTDDQLERLAS